MSGEVIDTHDQYEVFDDPRAVRLPEYLDESGINIDCSLTPRIRS